ncbi:MAG: hypothetical protein NVS4B3_26330 [Gemmatimonadaceae bacterium]
MEFRMSKDPYEKPSVLRLDYTIDAEVVSFAGCKTINSATGKGPITTGACNASGQCNSNGNS